MAETRSLVADKDAILIEIDPHGGLSWLDAATLAKYKCEERECKTRERVKLTPLYVEAESSRAYCRNHTKSTSPAVPHGCSRGSLGVRLLKDPFGPPIKIGTKFYNPALACEEKECDCRARFWVKIKETDTCRMLCITHMQELSSKAESAAPLIWMPDEWRHELSKKAREWHEGLCVAEKVQETHSD